MDEKNELEKSSAPLDTQKQSTESVPDIEIPTVRTFKNDISQTVKRDNVTTSKIFIAEQNNQNLKEDQEIHSTVKKVKNSISILVGILLFVSSFGLVAYFGYSRVTKPQPVFISENNSFLFVFDDEKLIDTSQSKEKIESELERYRNEVSQKSDGTYTEIIFHKEDTETNTSSRISSLEFFKLFDIPVITNVARSISQDFSYGFYAVEGRAEPFLIVGLVDYENAYASMFLWESTLAIDIKSVFPVLKNLFDVSKIIGIPQPVVDDIENTEESTEDVPVVEGTEGQNSESVGTDNSTSTPSVEISPEQEQRTIEQINRSIRFTDVVLSNYNTRAVRNENGSPFFYYAFIEREKILFAQDPRLIGEIIRKIKQKNLIR